VAKSRRSDCPISFALDIFGDRWTLLVIRDLLFKGKSHYRDFVESEERIATNILADRLKSLEEHGIVTRNVAPRNAGGVSYRLTPKGLDLAPTLVELILWSATHDPDTAASPEFVTAAREDRTSLLAEIASGGRVAT
jgi:DNA-binding HxlR family transcriptional regulator